MNDFSTIMVFLGFCHAYSQLGYPKGWSNKKRIAKDYFGFLLHLLFHDYIGLIYDYNYNDSNKNFNNSLNIILMFLKWFGAGCLCGE
jgi:hypothetical protein